MERSRYYRYGDGPTPLPLIGNIHTLARMEPGYEALRMWQKQYGPVFTYWIAESPVVVVCDYALMKDTFVKDGDAYAGRNLYNEIMELLRSGTGGILWGIGEPWKVHRKFSMNVLKTFTTGTGQVEEMILTEVQEMLDSMEKDMTKGKTEQDMMPLLELSISNIINQIIFGYRFTGDLKKQFYQLYHMIDENVQLFGNPNVLILNMLPFLRHWPYFSTFYWRMQNNVNGLYAFFDRQVEDFKEKLQSKVVNDSEFICYVEAFLKEMEEGKNSADKQHFTLKELRMSIFDLWATGQETSANTLGFGVLYLLLDQEVQRKLQAEIDAVVPRGELVTLAHRAKLTYTLAVINEIQRLCNLLPHNAMRQTTRDVVINGHPVPGATNIKCEISNVLYDDKPYRFKPERFIDANGQLKKYDEFVPFALGKRSCIGENLARMELFLNVTNLFHKFKILPVDPLNPPTSEKVPGFTVRPHAYTVRVAPRDADDDVPRTGFVRPLNGKVNGVEGETAV
ncbi:Protein CYP-33E1 [Aphelenchoides avenae]|nr:Protein CYP-33E1 [Aphelenchus avenae]